MVADRQAVERCMVRCLPGTSFGLWGRKKHLEMERRCGCRNCDIVFTEFISEPLLIYYEHLLNFQSHTSQQMLSSKIFRQKCLRDLKNWICIVYIFAPFSWLWYVSCGQLACSQLVWSCRYLIHFILAICRFLLCSAAQEQRHAGLAGKQEVDGRSEALELQSSTHSPGKGGQEALNLVFRTSTCAHRSSCPLIYSCSDIRAMKSLMRQSGFSSRHVSFCQVRLLILFPIFMSWLATAAFHFLPSQKRGISHYPFS